MVSFILTREPTASPHTPPAEPTLSPRSFHFAVFEAGSHVLGTQYVANTDLELLIYCFPCVGIKGARITAGFHIHYSYGHRTGDGEEGGPR